MLQEFVQAVNDSVKKGLQSMHTCIPGTVTAFDPATCRASVKPTMLYRKPDGTTIPYPEISGVPVCFPQGAGQSVCFAFPVKAGDGCLILAAEQSLDYWMYQRETDTKLRFDLTDAIIIPGLFLPTNPAIQKACDENAAVVMNGEKLIVVKQDGILIEGDLTIKGKIKMEGDVTITGDVSVEGKIDATEEITAPNI